MLVQYSQRFLVTGAKICVMAPLLGLQFQIKEVLRHTVEPPFQTMKFKKIENIMVQKLSVLMLQPQLNPMKRMNTIKIKSDSVLFMELIIWEKSFCYGY